MQLQMKEKEPSVINMQLVALFFIVTMLSFGAGWLAYDVLAPITAKEFIDRCDSWVGAGEWMVKNNTCVPISYVVIPEETNITLPTRGK